MTRREKSPAPIVRKLGEMLSPVSQYDAGEIDRLPNGTEFDLIPRTKRSLPQHRTYWKALTLAVEASGRWPSREALHDALKINAGLTRAILNLRGEVIGMQADSTALDAMGQAEFSEFFEKSMAALSAALGFDPLEWMAK